jgi:hypothetical protein
MDINYYLAVSSLFLSALICKPLFSFVFRHYKETMKEVKKINSDPVGMRKADYPLSGSLLMIAVLPFLFLVSFLYFIGIWLLSFAS